ncbi:MAG: DnaB-like helicase N-terminal domain-containing protein [Novosphingobium sp.]
MNGANVIPIGEHRQPEALENIEAEAAFLGACLIDNRCATGVASDDFALPVHAQIYAAIQREVDAGRTASAILLKPMFENDAGIKALGGVVYLARLTADAQGLLAPVELAQQIAELAHRRRCLDALDAARWAAADLTSPLSAITLPEFGGPTESPFQSLDLAALASIQPQPKAMAIERLAPVGEVTLFTGPGSGGKSLLAQQFATAAAAGIRCLRLDVIASPAIYLTCEDDADQLHWRQSHICTALLASGKDLQAALTKAVSFESVFTRLKAYTDPVGAALDTLDKEFGKLKSIFTEASASTQEYADLEKLYGLERAKAVKAATDQILSSLTSLYDQLTVGNSALSLSDRKSAAQANYQPLAARVAAGDTSAYDAYSSAATALLDIERQISGSQSDYFTLLDQVTSLTKGAIDGQTTIATASANRDNPFTAFTASAADNQGTIDAIGQLGSTLLSGIVPQLSAVNANLGKLIQQGLAKDAASYSGYNLNSASYF